MAYDTIVSSESFSLTDLIDKISISALISRQMSSSAGLIECMALLALLHFFNLTNFFWMMVEGSQVFNQLESSSQIAAFSFQASISICSLSRLFHASKLSISLSFTQSSAMVSAESSRKKLSSSSNSLKALATQPKEANVSCQTEYRITSSSSTSFLILKREGNHHYAKSLSTQFINRVENSASDRFINKSVSSLFHTTCTRAKHEDRFNCNFFSFTNKSIRTRTKVFFSVWQGVVVVSLGILRTKMFRHLRSAVRLILFSPSFIHLKVFQRFVL